ncbi:MAG: peptidylprolyl isomerase [gamma proteobacterium symbiont of Bathyaustriella thionipta]|nr:peptidylprolyl isomerase [gamma proteobacterium symbiont of Bathyaustriella thionipta]
MTVLKHRLLWLSGLLALLCSVNTPAAPFGGEEVDHIVAVVNDDVIVRSELDERIHTLISGLQAQRAQLPPQAVLEKQVLKRLIISRMQLQKAKETGLSVTDETLAGAIGRIADKNNLSISELRTALESEGLSFNEFRDELRTELLLNQVQERMVRSRIHVSDQEIDQLLNQNPDIASGRNAYRISHILIATPEAATSKEVIAAREKAEKLVKQLRAGGDFVQAALATSSDSQAFNGGDLGWKKPNELPTLFSDIVDKMERGDISDPIQSSSGFHIIKLVDYRGGESHVITQTHVRHILLRTNEVVSDQDAKTRLQQLRQRIIGGDSFTTLARSHSDDSASAIKGGDLGWVNPGDLAPQFEEQMDKLADNDLSQPFKTTFGWHLVQVLGHRSLDKSDEVARSQARKIIRQKKMEEELSLWQRRLLDEAFIEYRLDDF